MFQVKRFAAIFAANFYFFAHRPILDFKTTHKSTSNTSLSFILLLVCTFRCIFGESQIEKRYLPSCSIPRREIEKTQIAIGYDAKKPPPNQVNVQCWIIFKNIFNLDESAGTIDATLVFFRTWRDERLRSTCNHPKIVYDEREVDQFWTPITSLSVLESKEPGSPAKRRMLTLSNGTFTDSMYMSVKLACRGDYVHFPFDQIECETKLTPPHIPSLNLSTGWTSHRNSLNLSTKLALLPTHLIERITLSSLREEFELGVYAHYSVCKIHLVRHIYQYIFQVYIPNVIAVLISWFSFFIECTETTARFCLSLFAMAALLIQYNIATQTLPKATYLKSLDAWTLACTVFVFLSLAETTHLCRLKRKNMDMCELRFKCIKIDYVFRILYFVVFFVGCSVYFSLTLLDQTYKYLPF